jgi:hypothetical protein
MSQLKENQKLLWEDLVQACKPQLDAMQQELKNKGNCFVMHTDKGMQLIPCEDIFLDTVDEG